MTTLHTLKIEFEERFHDKWTSLSVQYHFKALVSKIVSIPFNEVFFHLTTTIDENQLIAFRRAFSRLETNEPLQYIIEMTEFMGFPIKCSPAALIPRPETEELVELIINTLKSEKKELKILDLCTGTGCIAIALQKLRRNSTVIALEYYDNTIRLARENIELNHLQIEVIKVDVLSETEMNKLGNMEYDIWVSNPPYIPSLDKIQMDENVLDFEPHEALFVADSDPLIFYKSILKSAHFSLKKDGWLFFEIHEKFGEEMIALLKLENFKSIHLHKDLQGKNRMISGQK